MNNFNLLNLNVREKEACHRLQSSTTGRKQIRPFRKQNISELSSIQCLPLHVCLYVLNVNSNHEFSLFL